MTRLLPALACLILALPGPAGAVRLELPAPAEPTAERVSEYDSHGLAISGYRDGAIDRIVVEGVLEQTAWRIPAEGMTTLQILAPLRAQLEAEGFDVLFDCADRTCGGFDFRFAADVLPEPAMHVDLGDFRYLAARRPGEGQSEYVTLFVSRSASAGFVQMTRVGPPDETVVLTGTTKMPVPAVLPEGSAESLIDRLRGEGRATLTDLRFETGSSELSQGSYASLAELAAFLKDDPGRTVVLVGHTDTEGTLENNVALSKRRATAVAARLIEEHGVAPEQLRADGVGYLAPVASNATEEGRMLNRRVEAVLTGGG